MQQFYAQYHRIYRRLFHARQAISILLGALLFCLATKSPAQDSSEAATIDDESAALAARAAPAAEQQWMQTFMAGNKPKGALWLAEAEQAFVGIYNSAIEPNQMGVLLLGNRPGDLLQANPLQQLAEYLPLHGWSSLIILLPPAPAAAALAERELGPGGSLPAIDNGALDNDDTSSAAADKPGNTADPQASNGSAATQNTQPENSPVELPSSVAAQRIEAGSRWLLDQGARSVALVSDAATLPWAISAATAAADTTSGLVLWHVDSAALELDKLSALRDSRVSILDVLPAQPDAQQLLVRKQQFKRAGFDSDYSIIVLPPQHPASMAASSNKRIRYWLDTEFEKN